MKRFGYLTDIDFWIDRQGEKIGGLPEGGVKPPWLMHVKDHLPLTGDASCLEVGVVPGSTLLYLGTHYPCKVAGLDYSPRIRELGDLFLARGVRAQFIEADFLTWIPENQFNFVYSCGFIEHFVDYQFVICKHWQLVKPGGVMLLTVPVLTPFQDLIRRVFYEPDMWDYVRSSHNPCVTPATVTRAVIDLPGSSLIRSGYASEMDIWFSPSQRGVRIDLNFLFVLLKGLERVIRKARISSRWYSPQFYVLLSKGESGK